MRKTLLNLFHVPLGSSPSRLTIADCAIIGALCAATTVVLGKDIASGGLADADSAAHAMDGVLIHDWIMAGPSAWRDPMGFARQQYGHYPTLGIGRHYPPGFALVEAAFFATFGISAVSARLCVLFFGLVATAGTFVYVRDLGGRGAGALAAMALLAMPATTLWGRQTMLEVPTVAVLVWGAITFSWYMRNTSVARLVVLVVVALSAILFKQTGVFLVCTLGVTITVCTITTITRVAHCVAVITIAVAVLLLLVSTFDDASFNALSEIRTYPNPWCLGALTFHMRELPHSMGWVLLVLAAFGAVVSRRTLGVHWFFLASWALVAYVMVTVPPFKVPRYFYVGLFPLVVWAALGLERLLMFVPQITPRRVLTIGAAACMTAFAFARPVRHSPDYGPVVAAHRDAIEGQVVLFSGLRDGDFIFAVREQVPWRRSVVIRGSKLLYTCTAGPLLDLVSYVNSADQLAEVMHQFAFEYVFVERENMVGTSEDDLLRRYLSASGDYQRVSVHALNVSANSCQFAKSVDVYKLCIPLVRQVEYFDIPMPRTGTPVRIDLSSRLLEREGPS